MTRANKTYLMVGGTLLPAFAFTAAHAMYHKRGGKYKTSDILIFAGGSILGGFLTAKMLKDIEVKPKSLQENLEEMTKNSNSEKSREE